MRHRRGFKRHHPQLLRHGAGVQHDAGQTSRGDAPVQHQTREEGFVRVVVGIRLTPVRRSQSERRDTREDKKRERSVFVRVCGERVCVERTGGLAGHANERELWVFFVFFFSASYPPYPTAPLFYICEKKGQKRSRALLTCTGCVPIWIPERDDAHLVLPPSSRRWPRIAAAPLPGSSAHQPPHRRE